MTGDYLKVTICADEMNSDGELDTKVKLTNSQAGHLKTVFSLATDLKNFLPSSAPTDSAARVQLEIVEMLKLSALMQSYNQHD